MWNTTERQWNARKEHKPLIFNILYIKSCLVFTIPRELKSKSIINVENGETGQAYYLHRILSK